MKGDWCMLHSGLVRVYACLCQAGLLDFEHQMAAAYERGSAGRRAKLSLMQSRDNSGDGCDPPPPPGEADRLSVPLKLLVQVYHGQCWI
jgi:hypothetical protein